ncbi:accessory regulator protein A [Oxobacter pfennigii]|uniref:Stage 0 sporulation protein A homolog n=1 Tax=Oxobacter pfennigii TaxID=36849 RepID=A0A0P8W433_9CLOT|nr:LytTR family DNA-binding domain-containing protein [Oxobacter pfennigii]KPU42380.1 accessory regulator protein A [Oxobacter pfennigii]
MHLNFILADNNKNFLENTCSYIKKFISEHDMDASLGLYTTNPSDVLEYANKNSGQINVYILDMDFDDEINGLALGRVIREKEPLSYIIYVTHSVYMTMMVFKYRLKVFDFLVKPISYSDIADSLTALVEDFKKISNVYFPVKHNSIAVKSGYQEYHIPVNDIVYIESFGPKLIIHTNDGSIEYYGTLKDIESSINELTDTFFRSHKSFLINTRHITEANLQDMSVTMSTGDKCLISRNKRTFLKNLASLDNAHAGHMQYKNR